MHCQACDVSLQSANRAGHRLEECPNCTGQFVSHEALRDLLLSQAETGSSARYARPSPLTSPVHYRKCPACTEAMARKNFAGASGVVIDVCPVHGAWLDRGKLVALMEFAATGAWKQAQRDTVERAKARKRLDAWIQELRLGDPQHGTGVGGLGEIARIIPDIDEDAD
jgi:Zn-finger nucleic acid-binding protein